MAQVKNEAMDLLKNGERSIGLYISLSQFEKTS